MQRFGDVSALGGTIPLQGSRVHIVGLCGYGLRGLVPLLAARGARISGSDKNDGPVLERFRRSGVDCWAGHSDRNLPTELDLVVTSAAISPDNPEVRAAERKQIQVLKYAQCLGYLMSEKQGIAVAGTHGKTTTSSLVAYVLEKAGLDPSYVIGGEPPDLGSGSHSGRGDYFVAEACEFDRSFLNLRPKAAIVTNVESEHLDYFGSFEEIQEAFREFSGLLPRDGLLVYNADDPGSRFLEKTPVTRWTFSLTPGAADWWVEDIQACGEGVCFSVSAPGLPAVPFRLGIPGLHNVRNALACAAVCHWAGVPLQDVASILEGFHGVRRRFDVLCRSPYVVVDDYAHHPTEVGVVVRTTRQSFPGREVVAVIQPHQHSRLRLMKSKFADALEAADRTLVLPVFRARDSEQDVRSVRSDQLVAELRERGSMADACEDFESARRHLFDHVEPGAIVLFLGAGSITELARSFAEELAIDPFLTVPQTMRA